MTYGDYEKLVAYEDVVMGKRPNRSSMTIDEELAYVKSRLDTLGYEYEFFQGDVYADREPSKRRCALLVTTGQLPDAFAKFSVDDLPKGFYRNECPEDRKSTHAKRTHRDKKQRDADERLKADNEGSENSKGADGGIPKSQKKSKGWQRSR